MAEPDWIPTYEIELREGGFKDRLLETVFAAAERETEAIAEAALVLQDAWEPGPRKGKRARPLIAIVRRVASGRSEEATRLVWTLDGVVRARAEV